MKHGSVRSRELPRGRHRDMFRSTGCCSMHASTSWSTWQRSGGLPCTGTASRVRWSPTYHYIPPTGLRSHTEMLDQVMHVESESDFALPSASLDLSRRMRDLRARQGLKQSELARRMRLDPSIPSLWEQGKRLVPANRVRALADALEVTMDELLEGVSGAQSAGPKAVGAGAGTARLVELIDDRAVRPHARDDVTVVRLVTQIGRASCRE